MTIRRKTANKKPPGSRKPRPKPKGPNRKPGSATPKRPRPKTRTRTPAPGPERLQKILSRAGMSSRRQAEEMILAGRVTVNGQVVTELGTRANPDRDRVAVDGRPIRRQGPPVYFLLNKPTGVMTTLSDPGGRPTVRDLMRGVKARVYPVGRLDFHSSGLLLMTNDGDLALRLAHPRYEIRKTYRTKVKGDAGAAALQRLREGVRLPEGRTAPATVRVVESGEQKSWLEITIAEGKKRQIRRMCQAVGLLVEKLERTRLGPLSLGRLPRGRHRPLTPTEIARLQKAGGLSGPLPGAGRATPSASRAKPKRASPRRGMPTSSRPVVRK